MFCPNCGTKLEEGSIFCSECGCRLADFSAAAAKAEAEAAVKTATEGERPEASEVSEAGEAAEAAASEMAEESAGGVEPCEQREESAGAAGSYGQPAENPGSAGVYAGAGTGGGKFCPNCGERLEAEALFCSNCGCHFEADDMGAAAVAEGRKKKRSVKVLKIAGIILLAAFMLGGLAALLLRLMVSPGQRFLLLQKNALEKKIGEPLKELGGYYKDGLSTDITISVDAELPYGMASDFLEDSALLVKLESSRKKGEAICNMALQYDGASLFSYNSYANKQEGGFTFPELNDDYYYITDYKKMLHNLDMDALAYLEEEKLAALIPDGALLKRLGLRYGKLLAAGMTKKSLKVEENKRYSFERMETFSGKSFRGDKYTVYTWKPKEKELEQILQKAAAAVEKDKDLKEWAENAADIMGTVEEYGALSKEHQGLMEFLESGTQDAADWLQDHAEDIAELLADGEFEWKLVTEGKVVRAIRIQYKDEPVLSYESYEDEDGQHELYQLIPLGFAVMNEYSRSGKLYEGSMVFVFAPMGSGISLNSTLLYSDVDLAHRSVFGIPYGEYRLKGGRVGGLENSRLTVEASKKSADHIFKGEGFSVTVNATEKSTAKKPSGNKVDISDYSREDLEKLGEEIGKDFLEVLSENKDLGELSQLMGALF